MTHGFGSTWVTDAHLCKSHTWHIPLSSCLITGGGGENVKTSKMFEDTVIREELWRKRFLVCWCLSLPFFQDNYLSSSVISFTAENRATVAVNDKPLGLVKTLTHIDTQTWMHQIAHEGLWVLLCSPSATISGFFNGLDSSDCGKVEVLQDVWL